MKLMFGGVLGSWITGGFFSHLLIEQQKEKLGSAKAAKKFSEIVCDEELNAPWKGLPDPDPQMANSSDAGSWCDPFQTGSLFRRRQAKELLEAKTKDVWTKDFWLFTHGFFRNVVGYEKAEEVVNSFWNR